MSCIFLFFILFLHSIKPQLSSQIERLKLNEECKIEEPLGCSGNWTELYCKKTCKKCKTVDNCEDKYAKDWCENVIAKCPCSCKQYNIVKFDSKGEAGRFLIGDWKKTQDDALNECVDVDLTKKFTCSKSESHVLSCLDLKLHACGNNKWETLRKVDSITWNGTIFSTLDGSSIVPTVSNENHCEIRWYSPSGTFSRLKKGENDMYCRIRVLVKQFPK